MKNILDILAWTPLGFIIVPILIFHPSVYSKYLDGWCLGLNGVVMGIYATIIIAVLANLTKC